MLSSRNIKRHLSLWTTTVFGVTAVGNRKSRDHVTLVGRTWRRRVNVTLCELAPRTRRLRPSIAYCCRCSVVCRRMAAAATDQVMVMMMRRRRWVELMRIYRCSRRLTTCDHWKHRHNWTRRPFSWRCTNHVVCQMFKRIFMCSSESAYVKYYKLMNDWQAWFQLR